jgi:hypothetical protein
MAPHLDTASILELAVLGSAARQEQDLPTLLAQVRALTGPWVSPTGEMIERSVARLRARGELRLGERPGDQTVRVTGKGNLAIAALMRRDVPGASHAQALAAEAVKLAFVDLLGAADRAAALAGLVAARERCRSHVGERLAALEDRSAAAAHGLRHQLRLVEAGLEAVRAHLASAGGARLVGA